jgi:hypothetical protein
LAASKYWPGDFSAEKGNKKNLNLLKGATLSEQLLIDFAGL